tara:strand:- start:9 stop:929 length:921 start_codon:yes stop_codon:yes gene_type:complete
MDGRMIEKIFIPTVNRVDNQITYNNLPDVLKSRVVMVVQEWERPLYNYPVEYLVLPSEVNLDNYYCIAMTRKCIYEAGQDMKYAVLDDDLKFGRRNQKYWGCAPNMDMSKRECTDADVLEMFDLYSEWLDGPVTICGCGHSENPPPTINYQRDDTPDLEIDMEIPLVKAYSDNSSLGSALWINGKDFKDVLPKLDLTSVKVMEDTYFLLQMLKNGFSNRVSQEFIFFNKSVHTKSMQSTIWDNQTFDNTLRDHKIIEAAFPDVFNILYDVDGQRVKGGFRDYGKVSVKWSKAYIPKTVSLEDLFND